MDQKITWGIVIVIIVLLLAGGGWWLMSGNTTSPVTPTTDNTTQTPSGQTGITNNPNQTNGGEITVDIGVTAPKTYTVTYTDSGYSPNALTIKKGDTVTFKNQSSSGMWTASAMHPTHTAYSGTNAQQHCPDPENNDFDECKSDAPGTSWSFTFTKTGSFGYHNHSAASHFGKITVE